MDDFYAARSRITPPLPWSNFAPPFSHGVRESENIMERRKYAPKVKGTKGRH